MLQEARYSRRTEILILSENLRYADFRGMFDISAYANVSLCMMSDNLGVWKLV
jgi:hypothetical protein